jgi:hypothetical protein
MNAEKGVNSLNQDLQDYRMIRIKGKCSTGATGMNICLLGIETHVFKIGTGIPVFCSNQIASGAVQPFPGIVGPDHVVQS